MQCLALRVWDVPGGVQVENDLSPSLARTYCTLLLALGRLTREGKSRRNDFKDAENPNDNTSKYCGFLTTVSEKLLSLYKVY